MFNQILGISNMADIDIRSFRETLSGYISEEEKTIPNCQEAFDKIENALDILEENFDEYHEDFIKTQDPSIIFSRFIADVSAEQKSSDFGTITPQFRKIITHLNRSTRGQIDDPQMKSILDMLNANINNLEHEHLEIFIENHIVKVRKRREQYALVAIFRRSDEAALRVFAEQLCIAKY